MLHTLGYRARYHLQQAARSPTCYQPIMLTVRVKI